ncbi:MAG: Uma2 family endonuclease [Xenococcaceae cyanobacterium]
MLTTKIPLSKAPTSPPLRLWTVEEYHRMAEVGILQPDEKVELIAGQIIRKMSPQGSPHAAAITRTNRLFGKGLGDDVLVRLQLPVQLNDFSEPEPDIAVVTANPLDYDDHHPTAEDVYLIVEIADSTLKSDCEVKGKDYARSGIEDYWVLDVNNRQLYVYREPTEEGYQREVILGKNEAIAPLQFSDCVIKVAEMLRPVDGA